MTREANSSSGELPPAGLRSILLAMPKIQSNGIQIEYEIFGDGPEPLLLIMGLGAQMILWDEEFCRRLADRGFRVIRFDNRDVGLSTHFEDLGVPNVAQMFADLQEGKPLASPYSVDDMADDTAGLLEALGIERAHVCGASMGGMIAQTLSYRHPQRVKSLISVMSSTGDPDLPQGKPEVMGLLFQPPPSHREGYIDYSATVWRAIGSPGFPFDEERVRERSGRHYDRNFDPGGVGRQMAAILAHGSRRERLGRVTAPTLVIHGKDDPLVPVEAGIATHEAIPGARLVVIEGMGHDFAPGAWPQLIDAISAHALEGV
jgi:pimeloyl-ACP methyl ester carboxylesterase